MDQTTSIQPAAKFTPINKPSSKGAVYDADEVEVPHVDIHLRAPERARTIFSPLAAVDDQFQSFVARGSLTSGFHEGRLSVTSKIRRHGAIGWSKRSQITEQMQVVKGLNNSDYSVDYKSSDQTPGSKRPDSVEHQGKLNAFKLRILELPEPKTSLLSPITSVGTLESSSGVGCSVYDARDQDARSVSSPSFGPKINRVLSRTLSPNAIPQTRKVNKRLKNRATPVIEVLEVWEEGSNAPILSTVSSGASPTNILSDAIACVGDSDGKDSGETGQGAHSNRISSPCTSQVRPFEKDVDTMDFIDDECVDDNDDDDNYFMLDKDDEAELEQLARSMEQNPDIDKCMSHQQLERMLSTGILDEEHIVGTEEMTKSMQTSTRETDTMASVPHHQAKGVPQQDNEVVRLGENAQVFPTPTSVNASFTWERSSTPITRRPFPEQVKDRSPVIGISANTVLRTCFRVGEALNTGCQAFRLDRHVVIELYARVKSSWHEEGAIKRDFTFSDLYHDNPPFMNGVYENCRGAPEGEEERARFLNADENEQLCRVVGTVRRRDGSKWEMVVLDVREVRWTDIEYIAGIHV